MTTAIWSARDLGKLGLLFVFAAVWGCRSGKAGPSAASRSHREDASIISTQARVDGSSGAGPPPVSARPPGGRHSILGGVVDFEQMKATATLADAPDEEITQPSTDAAVVLSVDSSLSGYRLSSGQWLWTSKVDGPCRHIALAGRMVYSACGDFLHSFAADSGKHAIVDDGPDVRDPLVVDGGAVVASIQGGGRVSLYAVGSEKKVASRVLPEITRAMHTQVVAAPASGGVCAIGLGKRSGAMAYHAGCYDRALQPLWTKWLPLKLTPDVQFEVAQLGPRFLVLDDQESVLNPSLPPGPGSGWLLQWKDGELTPFKGETFATVESPAGTRLRPQPDFFAETARLDSVAANGAPFAHREAQVVSDHERAYAIVVNRAAGVAGVDTTTGHTLFLVPLRLGETWSLEVVEGYPVVRTRFTNSWIATIHDPNTGATLYRDERARTPGH